MKCEQCDGELPPGKRKRFCSNDCGTRFHNTKRDQEGEKPVSGAEIRPIDAEARQLIVGGYLPESYTIDPHDGRPLWDFGGLCTLLNQRPAQLVEVLTANGAVYGRGVGIPSSWRMFVER
jgi:hypothetical protein